jgi:hypothetical protein
VERNGRGEVVFDSHGNYKTVFEFKERTWEQTACWRNKRIITTSIEYVGVFDVFEETIKINARTSQRRTVIMTDMGRFLVEPCEIENCWVMYAHVQE